LTYGAYGEGSVRPENLAASLEQLDAALAIRPFSSALVLKASLLGGWRGDFVAMREVLNQQDKLPLGERTEDRSICVAMWAGLMEHRPDRVESAATLTARNYFDDIVMPLQPKAWSLALAHQVAGKDNLARADWSAAAATLRARIKDDPANTLYQAELACTLAWLGQREEAVRLIEPVEPQWKEAPNQARLRLLARFYAAMGDAVNTAPYLAQVIDRSPFFSRRTMPLDPWWAKLRGQPEFDAMLKEPEAKK
jgi:hypothetical protein